MIAGLLLVGLIVSLVVMLIIRGTGNTDDGQQLPPPISEEINQKDPVFLQAGLISLDNCQGVLDYYKEHALKQVTAWGLGGYSGYQPGDIMFGDAMETTAESSTSPSAMHSPSPTSPSFSTTNIQVAGVDEADIVKTDGSYIYTTGNESIKIFDVRQTARNQAPKLAAEVELDFYPQDILLSVKPEGVQGLNDTLIVIGSPEWTQLRLVQIDIRDRQAPKIAADYSIDGEYVGMRLVDNTVRLVTKSVPLGLQWHRPEGAGLRAEEKALEANKELINNSELTNWIPAYKDNLKKNTQTSALVNCSQMLAPRIFSGLNTLSIVTFNASKPLSVGSWRALGVAADGQKFTPLPNMFMCPPLK